MEREGLNGVGNFLRHKILAVYALTGGLIWEERGQTM